MGKALIGVFDSGAGGLRVLKALRRHAPDRDFIYLGDTRRHRRAPHWNREAKRTHRRNRHR